MEKELILTKTKEFDMIFMKEKLVQAYLITGNNLENLEEKAFFFAKRIYCLANKDKECSLCNVCKKIDSNNYPNLFVLKAEGKVIKKENIIKIIETINIKTFDNREKIYIISEAEKLTKIAVNMLLKSIEEPPEGVVFMFLTQNSDKILLTIKSRCQNIQIVDEDKKDNELIEMPPFFLLEQMDLIKDILYKKKNLFLYNDYIKKDKIITIVFGEWLESLCSIYKEVLNKKIGIKTTKFVEFISDLEKISKESTIESTVKNIKTILDAIEKSKHNSNEELIFDRLLFALKGE